MQMTRPSSLRARAGLAVAVVAATLGFTPVTVTSADAVPRAAAGSVSTECSNARAALAQVRRQQTVALAQLVNARKALRKALKAKHPVKIRQAKKAVAAAGKKYRTVGRAVAYRSGRASYACSAPTSAVRAEGAGRSLALLAVANGLSLGPVSAEQLSALLDKLLPGLSDDLTDGQAAALLKGFNAIADGDFDPTSLLTVLAGSFTQADVTALLGGAGGAEVVTGLLEHIVGQLGGLGGLPVPGDLDLDGVLTVLSGIFGDLDPAQLGELLALVSAATGGAGGFDLGQLTALLDALVPGLSEQFDPEQLTAMLGAFNVGGEGAAGLADLLGGQFSPEQIAAVLEGTAGPELVGEVIAQVIAQLATAGGGGLELPTGLGLEDLVALVGTVTDLLDALTGGGLLPVVCGVVPIPGLCD